MKDPSGSNVRNLPAGFERHHQVGRLKAVATTPERAAKAVCSFASTRHETGIHIHLINAYTVALADSQEQYRSTLSNDSINLPDGKPLSWVSRIRRDREPLAQVRGPQFFLDVFDEGRAYDLQHYLLGSTEEVLKKLHDNLLARFPGIRIVGAYSPPFREMTPAEYTAQDETIRDSGAQIVWVGLGTPKQDYEARRLAHALPVVAVAVGAAFDFAAGTVKEAPAIYRKLGLEWLYRLSREPRRLWRRYLFGNTRFLKAAVLGSRTGT